MSHKKLVVIILLGTAIFAGAVFYFGFFQKRPAHEILAKINIDGVVITPAKEINDFHLTDNTGKPFSKQNMQGHWTLMFFGFTNCSMVCPVTMSALNQTYRELEEQLPDNKLPMVIMVSVDPERDTVSKMNTYVPAFNPHFIGLSGKMSETVALEKQLHIAAVKVIPEGQPASNYYYDHSAEILLFNPDAKLQAYLSYPHDEKQMVEDYKLILNSV